MIALELSFVEVLLDKVELIIDNLGYPLAICVTSIRT